MSNVDAAALALITVGIGSGVVHIAWARAMLRSSRASRQWFHEIAASKGRGIPLDEYEPAKDADRALARLRPWETASRVAIGATALYLALALLIS